MRKLLIILFGAILSFMSTTVSAEQTGIFLSIEEIEISDEFTLPAGSTVEFLGVIDVLTTVSKSGRSNLEKNPCKLGSYLLDIR